MTGRCRFDEEPAPSKIPLKTVAGFVVRMEGVVPLSEDEIRDASQTDNLTGKRIPAEPGVRFADGLDFLPEQAPPTLEGVVPTGPAGPNLH